MYINRNNNSQQVRQEKIIEHKNKNKKKWMRYVIMLVSGVSERWKRKLQMFSSSSSGRVVSECLVDSACSGVDRICVCSNGSKWLVCEVFEVRR